MMMQRSWVHEQKKDDHGAVRDLQNILQFIMTEQNDDGTGMYLS